MLKCFLYLVSTFISNRLTTNKSLCKTLMQGILGYGLFALGLKYLTIKKNNIKRNRIFNDCFTINKIGILSQRATVFMTLSLVAYFMFTFLNFNIYVLKPSISIYFK